MKKLICLIFSCIFVLCSAVTAAAYEPTGVEISAKAGMLVSLDTGEILYENNADQKVYPASIAKIMTTLLILESERYNPDATVAMSKEALNLISGTGSAVSLLTAGEQMTHLDLVYMVLMASQGDCAYLAALTFGDTVENFVAMMNARAAELGLSGTHYGNPVGLHDEETYTTVKDIYKLTKYALNNKTFSEICSKTRYTLSFQPKLRSRTISTTVLIQDITTAYYYTYAKGVKTGYTDKAGRCLVSTASYNGYNYMCILMGCPVSESNRYEFTQSANLYRWAFNNFEFKKVADSDNPVCEVPVELSLDTDFVPLYIEGGFVSVLPKDADESTIVIKPHPKAESVDAPIKKGDILGTADIIYAEKVIGTVNLVAADNIKKSGLLAAARAVKGFFTSIYMKIIYALIILVIIIFIVMVVKLNYGRFKKRKVKYIPYDKHGKGD